MLNLFSDLLQFITIAFDLSHVRHCATLFDFLLLLSLMYRAWMTSLLWYLTMLSLQLWLASYHCRFVHTKIDNPKANSSNFQVTRSSNFAPMAIQFIACFQHSAGLSNKSLATSKVCLSEASTAGSCILTSLIFSRWLFGAHAFVHVCFFICSDTFEALTDCDVHKYAEAEPSTSVWVTGPCVWWS